MVDRPDGAEELQPAPARHLFVEQHDAVRLALEEHERVVPVGSRLHRKSLLLQKEDVRGEAFDLIVDPENALGTGHGGKIAGVARRSGHGATFRCPSVGNTFFAVTNGYNHLSPDILAIRFSAIGDILLTTPLFRAIRLRHPGARIAVLTKRQYAPLLSENPNVNEVFGIAESDSIRHVARSDPERQLQSYPRPARQSPDAGAPDAGAGPMDQLLQTDHRAHGA